MAENYGFVIGYDKAAKLNYAVNSVTAIFNDPQNQVLQKNKREMRIRRFTTRGPKNYRGRWNDGFGSAEMDYDTYYMLNDREFSFHIDSLAEIQSVIDGGTPTLKAITEQYNKCNLIPEMDALFLAKVASKAGVVKVAGTDAGYSVETGHIYETLTNIQAALTDKGYKGKIALYLRPTIYAGLKQELMQRNIAANPAVIARQFNYEDLGVEGYEDVLKIDLPVVELDNFYLYETPSDRMNGKNYVLDGYSAGQENGGYIAAKNLSSYYDIDILAIPVDAAFTNVTHEIANLVCPGWIDPASFEGDIALANKKLLGTLELQKISGDNQLSDGFDVHERTVFDGDVFAQYADAVILVKGAVAAQTVAPVKATCVAAASALSGAKTTTSDIKVAFEDLNCSGTVYFASATTASATVDASETLTVPTSGDDLRPYCSPTVTFGNTAGTSVISVYSDAGKTVKIGEFTVTSEG